MIIPGTPLYGFCGGYFGRDSYWDKRVEQIGVDWVVARELAGDHLPVFAYHPDIHDLLSPYTKPEESE